MKNGIQFKTLEEAQTAYDELYEDHWKLLDESQKGIEKTFELLKSFGEVFKLQEKRKM